MYKLLQQHWDVRQAGRKKGNADKHEHSRTPRNLSNKSKMKPPHKNENELSIFAAKYKESSTGEPDDHPQTQIVRQVLSVLFCKTKTHFGLGAGSTPIPLSLFLCPSLSLWFPRVSTFPACSHSLCPFVSPLVSPIKLQRFLGNMVFQQQKKKGCHGIFFFFWQMSLLLLRIWGCHDISWHILKHTIVFKCACARVQDSTDITRQPQTVVEDGAAMLQNTAQTFLFANFQFHSVTEPTLQASALPCDARTKIIWNIH